MKINKKHLITTGCSFTEGHHCKTNWAKKLSDKLDLNLINLGKGGSGNELITQNLINYCTIEKKIANNSFFVIQLSECLRYLINYDNLEKENSMYWHITPGQFISETGFDNWDLTFELNKHIYDNRYGLAPFYSNITFSLIKTYWNIINLVNFFERNNYPYLIFDGLNNHIPSNINGKWYLHSSSGDKKFEIEVSNEDNLEEFVRDDCSPKLHKTLIDYISNLEYYYNDTTLWKFIHKRENLDYHKGNGGHPNELGSEKWAEELIKIIGDKCGNEI